MNNRLIGNLSLVAALAVLLALFTTYNAAWARTASAYDQINLLVDLRHELATGRANLLIDVPLDVSERIWVPDQLLKPF